MVDEQVAERPSVPVVAGRAAEPPPRTVTLTPSPPLHTRLTTLLIELLENRRLLILQPFVLIAGILAYRVLPATPNLWALAALLAFTLTAAALLRQSLFGFNAALVAMGFAIGLLLLPVHGVLFGTKMLSGSAYGAFSAHVDAIHSDDGEDARIIISNIASLGSDTAPEIRRARLFMPSEQRPEVGDTISGRIRFYSVPGPVMPNGFDSQFQAYFDGIGAFATLIGDPEITKGTAAWGLPEWTSHIRQSIGARIDATLDGTADAITRALIIGDQGQITDDTRKAMASAGLAHMLAISGLHLTLVAGGVFAALRMGLALSYRASLNWDLKRFAAVAGIFTALFYLAISGASVSAVRATIMLVLVFGAVLVGRQALTMRNVAIAALIVIITDPASIFRPSFQLSFAAVTALVATYESYRPQFARARGWTGKFVRFIGGLALTSIIAGLATGLFAAFHFQQMAPLGLVGNVIAVPILAFVVLPFAFLGVVAMPLGLDPVFFEVTGVGIGWIVAIAHWVTSLSGDWTSAPPLSLAALLFGTLTLLWLAIFPTRIRFAAIPVLIPLVALFGFAPRPDILMADSTQALAIRLDNNLQLVSGRGGTFAVTAWQETLGEDISPFTEVQMCDESACYLSPSEGYEVSYVKTRDAFAEDCRTADLVITRLSAPAQCRHHTLVVDRFDLLEGGGHQFRWTGTTFEIEPAIPDPDRPWRPGSNASR